MHGGVGVEPGGAGDQRADPAVGEQSVDELLRGAQTVDPAVAGEHDVLGVVLVGGQPHGAGLDAQRDVLGHQHGLGALGAQVECAGEDAGVVAGVAESGGQDGLVGVVELDAQGAGDVVDDEVAVEAAVSQPHVFQQAQCLAGVVAQLGVVTLGLEFTDHRDRQHHMVLGEAGDGPRIGQQNRGVEDVGTYGVGHGALLARGTRGRVGVDRSDQVTLG